MMYFDGAGRVFHNWLGSLGLMGVEFGGRSKSYWCIHCVSACVLMFDRGTGLGYEGLIHAGLVERKWPIGNTLRDL